MKQIITEQKSFYENLYTSKLNKTSTYEEMSNSFTAEHNMPKLTDTEKAVKYQ